MGLFGPAWASHSEPKALKAVEALSDERELAQVAISAPLTTTQVAALERVSDPRLLA